MPRKSYWGGEQRPPLNKILLSHEDRFGNLGFQFDKQSVISGEVGFDYVASAYIRKAILCRVHVVVFVQQNSGCGPQA